MILSMTLRMIFLSLDLSKAKHEPRNKSFGTDVGCVICDLAIQELRIKGLRN